MADTTTQTDDTDASHDLLAQMATLRPTLLRHALMLTRNQADAEDLVQTAFERALRHRRALEPNTLVCGRNCVRAVRIQTALELVQVKAASKVVDRSERLDRDASRRCGQQNRRRDDS